MKWLLLIMVLISLIINKENIYGVQFHPEKVKLVGEANRKFFKFKKMKKKRLIPLL